MTHPNKRRGDRAEIEVQGLLRDLIGVEARRKLGAGRKDDMGDMDGVPLTCVQVTNTAKLADALAKVPECEAQQARAGALFGATFVRIRGGRYVVALSPEQWATYWREATA